MYYARGLDVAINMGVEYKKASNRSSSGKNQLDHCHCGTRGYQMVASPSRRRGHQKYCLVYQLSASFSINSVLRQFVG
jgi:hypothetical protein